MDEDFRTRCRRASERALFATSIRRADAERLDGEPAAGGGGGGDDLRARVAAMMAKKEAEKEG